MLMPGRYASQRMMMTSASTSQAPQARGWLVQDGRYGTGGGLMAGSGASWLVYHPRRQVGRLDGCSVYHDSTAGNQDPYVWNDAFLHSYCHITQLQAEIGGIHLWVSGDAFPGFSRLYCDLVFIVAQKRQWRDANAMAPDDPLMDSAEAFNDHYRWHSQHPFARRKRYTLKAEPERSFQPQTANAELIDIVPLLARHGLLLGQLQAGLCAGRGSRPVRLERSAATATADQLRQAPLLLKGPALRQIRLRHPELASDHRRAAQPSPGRLGR